VCRAILMVMLVLTWPAVSAAQPCFLCYHAPAGGIVPTYPLLGGTGCTSPPYSFTDDTDAGVCLTVANAVRLQNSPLSSSNGAITIGTTAITHTFNNASSQANILQIADGQLFFTAAPSASVTFNLSGSEARVGSATTNDQIKIVPVAAGGAAAVGSITSADLTSARTWTLPDSTGEVALAGRTLTGTKTLTDASATSFIQVAIASESTTFLHIEYSVEAENATDQQVIGGQINIGIIHDAGVETCSAVTEVGEVSVTSTGTITFTATCDTSPTNAVNIQANADTSLNVSPILAYSVRKNGGSGAITPQ